MTGLRERKKADTKRALSDAALQLAFEHGLENVTREDVANLAGVSVRTFNNYFSGKYEALAYRQAERVRRSIAVLRQRPADEPLWTAITHAVLEPLEADFAMCTATRTAHPAARSSSRSENWSCTRKSETLCRITCSTSCSRLSPNAPAPIRTAICTRDW